LKTFKPDIIHAHDIRASVYASFISFNIPVISHLHGNQKAMRKISIKSILYLISTFKVKTIIAVSDSCINDFVFKRIIKRKAVVIKNVIHLKRLEILMDKDEESYNFDFVFLGRLSYPKDPKRVALVASNVLKKCSFAKFGVIGDGELQKEMINVFEEQNVIDRVVFTGKLPYPYKALKSAKCLLMCSIYEGLPIAALEAMALGVPVVSTPVDGIKDLIINNQMVIYLMII
jgi:glycosyltransferase involved in cell wall biosynthesis